MRVILAPPEMDYDKLSAAKQNLNFSAAKQNFPKIEKRLTQGVREFLEQHYPLHSERATEFLGGRKVKRFLLIMRSSR